MKKLLLVLAIGSFVACNDGGSAEETKAADSTAPATVDSTPAPAPVDSIPAPVDSTKKVDSVKKK
jgi:hypothetical protein